MIETEVITVLLLFFLLAVGIIIGRSRSLFAAVMLSGIFSLLSAGLFVLMDAVRRMSLSPLLSTIDSVVTNRSNFSLGDSAFACFLTTVCFCTGVFSH